MEPQVLNRHASVNGGERKIRALVIDDSALMRRMISEILIGDPGIEVVGTAADPYSARDKIKQLDPDVLTLDVEMPRMDGIQFLRNLMRLRPMPVVMISALTTEGANVTLDALEIGAVDYVSKPRADLAHAFTQYADEIVSKVKAASRARVRPYAGGERLTQAKKVGPADFGTAGKRNIDDKIIAVGASTGGTEAIKDVLLSLPAHTPPIVVAQHIPEHFSNSFARRLDTICAQRVCEAEDGQSVRAGHVYIAPGNRHLRIERNHSGFVCRVEASDPVNRHRPSVCVLFQSIAKNAGPNALGVILTGMGDDGAEGIKRMREAGAYTIAQDEASSVVWGMPGQAVKRGGIDEVLPLDAIGSRISSKLGIG